MDFPGVTLVVTVVAVLAGGDLAVGQGPCHACRGAGGMRYEGPVCGPRVRGPAHESVGPVDQCDGCARFHGCDGYRQLPDMLAPWQLPPGRGFQPPEALGYRTGFCTACAGGRPLGGWFRHR